MKKGRKNRMSRKSLVREIAIGAISGIIATRITDSAETFLLHLTPSTELAREPDRSDGSSATSAARKVINGVGKQPSARELRVTKCAIHYGLGASWGALQAVLGRKARIGPLRTGLVGGAALSIIVDETANPVLGITPPNQAFPASSHIRGFLTHMAWGLSATASAQMIRRFRVS